MFDFQALQFRHADKIDNLLALIPTGDTLLAHDRRNASVGSPTGDVDMVPAAIQAAPKVEFQKMHMMSGARAHLWRQAQRLWGPGSVPQADGPARLASWPRKDRLERFAFYLTQKHQNSPDSWGEF